MGVGRSEASRHNQTPPSSCRSLYPSATSSPSISLLLFLLVFIILRIQLVLADPCSVPSPTLAKNVLECYQSFSLPDAENTRSLAITAVRSYLELYPYLTLQRTAGSYDIIGELESIRTNTAIDTEFALQAAITRAFTLLHDAHTVYNADCFSVYQFLQPWIIKPVYNSHASLGSMARKPRLFLGGMIDDGIELGYFLTRINSTRATGIVAGMMEIWREELKADPRDFLNYEVVAIDGRDPVDTVQSFANEMVGLSVIPTPALMLPWDGRGS
ncbi:hypothetical protein BC829DRAFT_59324 [Chytridium lagenaria]|nr:hypothetical protein BC829DRAFT_59324 [Chytridium lagenaria]